MSDDANLAEQIFTPEPVEQEHDQERVCAIRVAGEWLPVIPGSLDLMFNDQGEIEFMADSPSLEKPFLQGKLSDITGLKSLPEEEPESDG